MQWENFLCTHKILEVYGNTRESRNSNCNFKKKERKPFQGTDTTKLSEKGQVGI